MVIQFSPALLVNLEQLLLSGRFSFSIASPHGLIAASELLCHAGLHHAVLCCAVLCCAVLCQVTLFCAGFAAARHAVLCHALR